MVKYHIKVMYYFVIYTVGWIDRCRYKKIENRSGRGDIRQYFDLLGHNRFTLEGRIKFRHEFRFNTF